jgi:hypothetical protein
MRRLVAAAFLIAVSSAPCRAQLSVEGALYYERGHYWIELAFRDAAGRDTLPADLSPAHFEIVKLEDIPQGFKPSRVEAMRGEEGGPVLVLTSAKLEGRACYRVIYRVPGMESVAADSICDPFAAAPAAGECEGKAFFRQYVAPAFRKDGGSYNLNELTYEYDFSGEEPSGSFVLQPSFKLPSFSFEPSFQQKTVVYVLEHEGKTSTSTRDFAIALTAAGWVKELRLGLSAEYRFDRSAFELAAGDSITQTRSGTAEGTVRFDNLFDRINRHCVSVFKGVDFAVGCTWYRSYQGDWAGSPLNRAAPYVRLRATWTILSGFQISYAHLETWPSFLPDGGSVSFRSLRGRLLLRDALGAQAGKAYHPDLELAYDWGTRFPNFVEEEKISIGFTFDLYPW